MDHASIEAYYNEHRNFLLKLHDVRLDALEKARGTGDQGRITAQRNKMYASRRRLARWTIECAREELAKSGVTKWSGWAAE